jgi:hypothetical protein
MIELVFFAPVLWFGVDLFGLGGAAVACALRVLLDLILLMAAAGREGGISARRLADAGIPRIAAALGIYTAALFAAKALPVAPLWIIFASAAYLVWAWRFALTAEEREGWLGLVHRFLGRKNAKESAAS